LILEALTTGCKYHHHHGYGRECHGIQWRRKSFRSALAYITFCRPSTIPDFHQYPQIVVKKIADLQLYVTLGGIECKLNKLLVFDSSIRWLMVSGKGGVHQAVKGVVGNFCGATVGTKEHAQP
jgi:hypothetical protein